MFTPEWASRKQRENNLNKRIEIIIMYFLFILSLETNASIIYSGSLQIVTFPEKNNVATGLFLTALKRSAIPVVFHKTVL